MLIKWLERMEEEKTVKKKDGTEDQKGQNLEE